MSRWIEESNRISVCARCPARTEVGRRIYMLRRGTYLCELCGSLAEHEEPETGAVEAGVLEDLELLPPEASKRTLAQVMLKTARLIDSGEVADRDIAPLLLQLRATLKQLQDDFPAAEEDDNTEKKRNSIFKLRLMDGELSE